MARFTRGAQTVLPIRMTALACFLLVSVAIANTITHAQQPLRPRRLPPVDGSPYDPAFYLADKFIAPTPDAPTSDFSTPAPPTVVPTVPACFGTPNFAAPRFGDSLTTNFQAPQQFAQAVGMPSVSGTALDPTIDDFSATPLPPTSEYHNPLAAQWIYDSKRAVPTQRPWVELGRQFYGSGITPRGIDLFGSTNLVRPQFYVYGDYRSGIIAGRNGNGRTDNYASLLNLDLDLRITDSERLHGFIGPLNRGGEISGAQLINNQLEFQSVFNPNFVTAFFEGDLGAIWGGLNNTSSPAEMPFTLGLVPLLFQNGIWMQDAVTGAAFAIPARHSRLLNWSNFDTTFFAIVDQLDSPAFGNDEHAAQAFGNAWFIEAYGGYIEAGYAYLRDRNQSARSYHNLTASFTRRYFDRISNSLRLIINTGQDLPADDRTADGGLFLWENSLITASPLTFVPYANFFYGWGRPQSVARAGGVGGILRNTGINFDTDGLNGFATLDSTGFDTAGGAIGVDLIGNDLNRQLLLEVAYLTEHGDANPLVDGDQFAVGARYQFPISNSRLLRFDVMHGWRDRLDNIYGTRMEYRWKF